MRRRSRRIATRGLEGTWKRSAYVSDKPHLVTAFMTYTIPVYDAKNTVLIQCLQHLVTMQQCLCAKKTIS